jgi:hypothetical protein
MGLSTNKPKLDLSGFDKTVKSKTKLNLSGFDEVVSKKKEPTVKQGGAESVPGLPPTQPGNGSSVSPSGDVTANNPKVNVRFNAKASPQPKTVTGFTDKMDYATHKIVKGNKSNLTPNDVEYITDELLNKAKSSKRYDADFFGTSTNGGVNKDYATKFLKEGASRVTFNDGKPLTYKDIEVLNTRWIEKLGNQKVMKPHQVSSVLNKVWMAQTKQDNPNLYAQLNPHVPQQVQKGKELKWEETSQYAGYFDKELLQSLTESEKTALGNYLKANPGVVQKMDRFGYSEPMDVTTYKSTGSISKDLQKDVIAQALGKQAQDAASRLQVYKDQGDTEKMKRLNELQRQLTNIQVQQNILQKSINQNQFDNPKLTPEQQGQLDMLKSQYQVLSNEYDNDSKDFESLKQEMEPVFNQMKTLEASMKESPEFTEIRAKLEPVFKQLDALKTLVQQGNTEAIIRNNQLVEYYKNDFAKYEELANANNSKVLEYERLVKANESKINLYNERVNALIGLETELNTKVKEFNTFVSSNNPQQISKVDQYKTSIEKYSGLVREAGPLYDEYTSLYSQLGEPTIKAIGEDILKINEATQFEQRMIAEREPSFREMMLKSPVSNKLLDYTLYPMAAEAIKFTSQAIAGGIKVIGDVGEFITLKPDDYYSFADFTSDVVNYGFDGSGRYWTDEILPGLRKSDFVDPITGELVYSPASIVVGSFEQMGQIVGAALGTYGSMGMGMARNAAVVTPMFMATYENNVQLARDLGYEGSSATSAGILFSMIEGFSELIFPDIDFFSSAAKKEAFKMFLENFSKGGGRMAVTRFMETTGKEIGEEYVVELGKLLATASTTFLPGSTNNIYQLDPAQLLETTIFVFTSAGAGAAVQAKLTTSKRFNDSMMFRMAQDLETSVPMIQQYNQLGKIDNKKSEQLIKSLKIISAVQGQLPNDISTPKRVVISSLYAQISTLEEKIQDPNITEEIRDSYKNSIKKLKDYITMVMLADDAEFTKSYNAEVEAQGKQVAEEVKKEHPDLGVAYSYLGGEKMEVSQEDQTRTGILNDIFGDSLVQRNADALEQRMKNAEEIPVEEINSVIDGLYAQLESIMNNYFDNPVGKQYAQTILDKIDKLNNYEFATGTKTDVITERKAIQTARASVEKEVGVIQSASGVSTKAGKPNKNAKVTFENGESGFFTIRISDQGVVTFEPMSGAPMEMGPASEVNKSIQLVDMKMASNGMPSSITFSMQGVGSERGRKTVTVSIANGYNQNELLDLAINLRAKEVGTVDPTAFDEAFEEVTREVETKTYPNMPAEPQAAKEGVTQIQPQDAVQVETAGQVPVQPEATVGEQVAQGEPQAEPQAPAQEGEEITDQEYDDFVNNGNITDFRIASIANKIKNSQELNEREKSMFAGSTTAINAKLNELHKADLKTPAVEKRQPRPSAQTLREAAARERLDKATQFLVKSFDGSGITVNIIEDEAEYNAIASDSQGRSAGVFIAEDGRVIINPKRMELATKGNRVLFHESSHPVLNILYNTDRAKYDKVLNGMKDSGKKGLPIWQDLLNFGKRYVDAGYSSEQVDNEMLTEAIGRIINGEIKLNDIPVGWRQAFIDMLNKIAKMLGIKPIGAVTDAGRFRDFAASLKDVFEQGKSIAEIVGSENITKYQSPFNGGTELTDNDLQYRIVNDFTNLSTGITFEYLQNSKEFQMLVDEGYITNNLNLEDFQDAFVVLHSPDAAFSGKIKKNGKVLVDGSGGIYYPIKFHKDGYIWASTKSGAAVLANVLNESARLNNGRVLLALTAAPKDKLLSSTTMANGVIDIFTSKIMDEKVNLRELDVVNALKNAAKAVAYDSNGNAFGLRLNLTGLKNLDEIVTKIKERLSPDKSSFKDRKLFSLTFLEQIATKIKGKEAEQIIGRFLSEEMGFEEYKQQGKIENRFNISKTNLTEAISNMLQEPLLRTVKENAIYAVIEVDASEGYKKGKPVVTVIESDKHDSYPRTIVPVNENIKVKLHILQDRKIWMDNVVDPQTDEIINKNRQRNLYPTTGVSTKPLRIKTQPSLMADVVNGFYSPIENRLMETKVDKQSANKWIGFMGKKDEAIYTGVLGWLESKNPQEQVSKKDIMDFMKQNRIEVREVDVQPSDMARTRYENERQRLTLPGEETDYKEILVVLPRKENKSAREILGGYPEIYTDTKKSEADYGQELEDGEELIVYPSGLWIKKSKSGIFYSEFGQEDKTFVNIEDAEKWVVYKAITSYNFSEIKSKDFLSRHYDEPNILVHLRMNTRTDANGNKVLFIEEIQSDWGQEGKKEGFISTRDKNKSIKIFEENGYTVDKDRNGDFYIEKDGETVDFDELPNFLIPHFEIILFDNSNGSELGIPSAPFVTDTNAWTKLGLKIALKEAIRQKADVLAWTTGEQQNQRYDLSKQVDYIEYKKNDNGTYTLFADKGGYNMLANNPEIKPNELESFVGKDIADKILNNLGEDVPSSQKDYADKILRGQDLKVGGKGMKAFYGDTKNPGIVGNVAVSLVGELTGTKPSPSMVEINSVEQPAIEVTPEVKASVKRGMPQFSLADNQMIVEKPGMDTLKAANISASEVANWRKQNKVSQREGRVTEVQQSAQDLADGKKTIYEHIETVKKAQPTRKTTSLKPMPSVKDVVSALADNQVKTGVIGLNVAIPKGTKVGSRLDIPSFNNYGINVVSVHDGTASGTSIGYGRAVSLSDVTFKTSPSQALNVATGASKGTFSRMMGTWNNESEESVYKRAKEALNDPNYIQIGTNPFRHSWFYDKNTGMPVMSASEILQVGNVVLAKDARVLDLTNAKDKAEFEDKFKVKLKSGKMSQFSLMADPAQVEDVSKKAKRAFPKGQFSMLESTVFMKNPSDVAQTQYPLYQAMMQLASDAFDNGARDIEAFKKYAADIQWPDELSRNYHTQTVWDDIIRIKQGKKPLINSQADYEKMLRNKVKSNASNLKEIAMKRTRKFKEVAKKWFFDSRAAWFNALARQSDSLFDLVAAYTDTIGGMTEKGLYQADMFMSTTYDGLSQIENIPFYGQMYSERRMFDEMLTLIGYMETNRKMEDKFDELIQLETAYLNETDPNKKAVLKDKRDDVKKYLDRNKVLVGDGKTIPYSLKEFTRSNLNMASAERKLTELSLAYPDIFDKLYKRADAYFAAWNTLLGMRLDAGMLSQESYDEMTKYKYVPTRFIGYLLMEVSDETDAKLPEATSDQIESLKGGSEEQLVMAYDESLRFASLSVTRSIQKNKAVVALSRAIDANPNQVTFFKPEVSKRDMFGDAVEWVYDKKNFGLIKYYVDGKIEAIATEQAVADAFNGRQENDRFQMPEGLGYIFMSTPFRMVTTNLNPGFGLAQIVIDLNQALLTNDAYMSITTGALPLLLKDIKLLGGLYLGRASKMMGLNFNLDKEWNELFTEAREYGALISFTQAETFESALEKASKAKTRLSNVGNAFSKVKEKIEKLNTSMEYVTRLAIFGKMKKDLINEYKKNNNGQKPIGQAYDDILTKAAATSMNMLNYNRGGSVIKPLNRVMAYLNVGFQVPYSQYQYAKKSPYLFTLKVSELAVYGVLVGIMLYQMLDDDDKDKYLEYYNRLSAFEKSNYWHYPNPFKNPDDPDTWLLRFKKPTILLPIVNTTEVYAMHYVTNGKTQKPDEYLNANPLKQDQYTATLGRDMYEAQPFKGGIISSMPTVNAAAIGFGNMDLYRMQEVVPDEKTIANPWEGLEDPRVGQFFKYVSQIGVESPYLADGPLSPKRMDASVKALIGDYSRNPVTAYPLYALGALMNGLSGYRDAGKYVPAEPEKDIIDKLIEGFGFTQRFTTRISDLKPRTKKELESKQVTRDAIYRIIAHTIETAVQGGDKLSKEDIRMYFKDLKINREEMFSVDEDYERVLNNAFKYAQKVNKIKQVENKYTWVKKFILTPSDAEKFIIWESETSDYSYKQKFDALKWLVENELFIPLEKMPKNKVTLDEKLVEDLKKLRYL